MNTKCGLLIGNKVDVPIKWNISKSKRCYAVYSGICMVKLKMAKLQLVNFCVKQLHGLR